MNKWILKKGEDRRLRSGHPWVFSNELTSSPKGIVPGELIEVVDQKGHFIARGYGNPHSLISFRAVTWVDSEKNILTPSFFIEKLLRAWRVRATSGLDQSFRLCYGEADGLPGLVVDRYKVREGFVFAVQLLTAGLQKAMVPVLQEVFELLIHRALEEGLIADPNPKMAIVLRNDVNIRKLEGMEVEKPQVIVNNLSVSLSDIPIAVDSFDGRDPIWMNTDLQEGQKTGFFLDQRSNIFNVLEYLRRAHWSPKIAKKVRILDLCCYVGHWSTQLVHYFNSIGVSAEVQLLDISKEALAFAESNVRNQSGPGDIVKTMQADVLQSLEQFEDKSFDIVIVDPPAFIKAKKDIPTGSHAYLKLNTQAFRVASYGGLVVSCSCSGLMVIDNFRDILRKAQLRNNLMAPSVFSGGHSPDHPMIMSFPEGIYLKMIGHLKI